MNTFRKTIAVASLLFSFSLAGCRVNAEESESNLQSQTETSCAESTKVFDASGAAEPNLSISDLPVGVYRHVSADFYVDATTYDSANREKDVSRVHFSETPSASGAFVSALRCRQVTGAFKGYFIQGALVVDFKNYDKARFDHASNAYTLDFRSATAPDFDVSFSGDTRSASVSNFDGTIRGFWNAGYRFARRVGETYEFYGIRIDPALGAKVYGKAVYVRSN